MKTRILSIKECGGELEVAFACNAGIGKAVLKSAPNPGIIGKELGAELDIDVPLELGKTCKYDTALQKQITVENDMVRLLVVVEAQDDDGLAYCRLSDDCLMMIDVHEGMRLNVGSMVNITVPFRAVRLTVV